jgi:hypothetical protein
VEGAITMLEETAKIWDFEKNMDVGKGDLAVLRDPDRNYGVLKKEKFYKIKSVAYDGFYQLVEMSEFPKKYFSSSGFIFFNKPTNSKEFREITDFLRKRNKG